MCFPSLGNFAYHIFVYILRDGGTAPTFLEKKCFCLSIVQVKGTCRKHYKYLSFHTLSRLRFSREMLISLRMLTVPFPSLQISKCPGGRMPSDLHPTNSCLQCECSSHPPPPQLKLRSTVPDLVLGLLLLVMLFVIWNTGK